MQHYTCWREDIDLARQLGVGMLRYGIPWYRVEPAPDRFDWSWTDQVLDYLVNSAGITPIIDLIHYGTPDWMPNSFLNSGYAREVATYARAFARRYRGLVRYYTPINEPTVNAAMCGMVGHWPPYLTGEDGYVKLIGNMAQGVQRTVAAIREVQPDSIMIHVDAGSTLVSDDPRVEAIVNHRITRHFVVYDLVSGRVDKHHRLYSWLHNNGLSRELLAHLQTHAIKLDVLGLNYYPWSSGSLAVRANGRERHRVIQRGGEGMMEMVRSYWQRYGVPIMITETSSLGPVATRAAWMDATVAAVRQLRGEGVPVIGYTWFPMFSMVDWKYRLSNRPLEQYLIHLGLWEVKILPDGSMPRVVTPLVAQYQRIINDGPQLVGAVAASGGEAAPD